MATELTAAAESGSTSFFSSLASFLLPTAHAEAPAEEGDKDEEESEDKGDDAPEEEEEEEEPEDIAPAIREQCQTTECVQPAKHFQHCADKVEAGKGWHGEDCVEELFHLMHCVDACAAPKVFKKLA
ncbi:hypothetical protein EHS25_000456 [Saitozyma podzolica]|uniref:Ubiquinol-cytochrome C reductase hinge domain-containing protein n=1 Tax=Saitozyma podzolica TaxID=1890683 RepID=A0A427YWC7_9TREE|nr:hypothetical protein EHS25_000456 [Saitozyma podzolica]